jgi:Zn-dependent protease
MLEPAPEPQAHVCPDCGTQVAPGLLTCPGCRRLVHAERLKQLADEAARAEHPTDALAAWRLALELLPPNSKQYQAITERVAALGRLVDQQPVGTAPAAARAGQAEAPGRKGWGGAAGGIGTLLVLALSKGKLLLVGLTKASTFWSMALSLGVYWTAWGWRFALGLVVSIYIHEMGHVAALRRYGIKATAPLFIPGVGAVIRLRQSLGDPRQDARVGLAGPLWGFAAAVAAALVGLATGLPIWMGIAKIGAWINLFNLLPFASLDGGRAFHALTRGQRWLAVLAIAASWSVTTDSFTQGLLMILLIVAGLQAAGGRAAAQEHSDRLTLVTYAALVACLTFLSAMPAPVPGG